MKIKLSPDISFIIFLFLITYFFGALLLINYLIVLILHEYSHAIAAKRLGYEIKDIKISPFGLRLNIKNSIIRPKDEFKIALAGPACNAVLAVLCLAAFWVYPAVYQFLYLFFLANIITAAVNLLPAYPLDGGRAFAAFLTKFMTRKKVSLLCTIINIVLAILLFVIFIVSIKVSVNFTYLFMGVFLIMMSINPGENQSYDYIKYGELKIKTGTKVQGVTVSASAPLFKLLKFLSPSKYIQFIIIEDNKTAASFYQDKLNVLCENFSPSVTLKRCLAEKPYLFQPLNRS